MVVVEGVLGPYDSVDGVSELGSTAQVAKLLKAPVVLVLNGDRVNRTLRAVVRRLKVFDPSVAIPGVILTRVALGPGGEACQVPPRGRGIYSA